MKIHHSYCRVALDNQGEATQCKVINRTASHKSVNNSLELPNNKYLHSDPLLERLLLNNLLRRINYTQKKSVNT
jgi:hypothetical protein